MRINLLALLLAYPLITQCQTWAPSTEKRPVVDKYFDKSVTDDYRWLEDGDASETKQWVAAENAASSAYLDKLPQRSKILAHIKARTAKEEVSYGGFEVRGGKLFALRHDPGQPSAKLVVFSSPLDKASERQIVDLKTFQPGKVMQVDWYRVSPDGKLAGMALSVGGSEDGSLYVVDTVTGRQVGATVPRVQFATGGGDIAWRRDNSGFYYTRYPQGSERLAEDANFYQQVYFHRLGSEPAMDEYVLGRDFPRVAETRFSISPDTSRLLVMVHNGDGGDYEMFLVAPNNRSRQLTRFEDKILWAQFGMDNSIWLLSQKNSDRGEIWHLKTSDAKLADAELVVAAGDASIEGSGYSPDRLVVTKDRLLLTVINGGPEQIRAYNLSGGRLPDVPIPAVASVGNLVPDESGAVLFSATTYTSPRQWYRTGVTSGSVERLPFHDSSNMDLSDIEVQRVFATSKDGTKIPMTVLMKHGAKLDGTNPALITGYGGYAISSTPSFLKDRLFLDQRGVMAIANIRGGAEYGDSWHTAGNLTHKQNVFDDFAACAQYLIDNKYAAPDRLAAQGGSNGGLLMGAMITQHPKLFRVVLSYVGIYDMLRVELDPNGSFNISEYGSVKEADQFKALLAYSPYHHVVPGTPYPAVLLITGDNDHRVNPMNSRKMAALLQSATSSGRPVLLLTNANAGHGVSTDVNEADLEEADALAFIYSQLRIEMH